MQVSAKLLSTQLIKQVNQHLAVAISEIKNPHQAGQFLDGFLTQTERTVLSKRLTIGLLLHKKTPYEQIKKTLNVSSATISGVAAMMKKPGFRLAIEKINEEEWADAQLNKLTSLFAKIKL